MADLVANQLAREYSTRGEPLVVLRDASFEINAGESLAILGPSGSGKSTLLHILGTLDQPTGGSLTLDGTNPFELDQAKLAAFRNQQVGFVFQDHHLLPQLSVLENVLVPTVANGSSTTDQANRARKLIERVGLTDRLDHRPAELSGGERQRVALARSLILQPKLVLADEPTGNLDPRNAQSMTDLLLQLQDDEPTILIVVTHSNHVADQLSRKCYLQDGKLVE
jgi:lipoprotein-releasing system ATP-binding protein